MSARVLDKWDQEDEREGWFRAYLDGECHIWPCEDQFEHSLESGCWCDPEKVWTIGERGRRRKGWLHFYSGYRRGDEGQD